MKHFSQPHSLKFSELSEKDDGEEIMCSGCEQKLISSDAYTCTKRKCDFVLHKSCLELPQTIENKSHPKHLFTLLSEPPEYVIYYDCRACGGLINGFSYKCDECRNFGLHVKCASLAEYVQCKAHSHTLELRYDTPKTGNKYMAYCDVCDGGITEGYWSYFCKECDFSTHLECALSAEVVPDKEEDEEENKEEIVRSCCEQNSNIISDKIIHPHSLKFSELSEKDDGEEIMCSGCEQKLSSPDAYTCTKRKCDFVLHKSCFELPQKTENKSHPEHPLTLLSEPPEYIIYYDCRACGELINGFSYKCDECRNFGLHVKCASLAEYVQCKTHSHALELRHYTPKTGKYMAYCDVCDGGITEGYWSYFCEECDFSTHIECAFSAEVVPDKEEDEEENEKEAVADKEEEEEENGEAEAEDNDDDDEEMSDEMRLHNAHIRAMDQMAMLNLQRQLNQMNAHFVSNLFRTRY